MCNNAISSYFPSNTADFRVTFEANLSSTTNPQARVGLYDGGNESMQNGLQIFPDGTLNCYDSGQSTDISMNALGDVNGNWEFHRINSVWRVYLNSSLLVETTCPGSVFPEELTLSIHNFVGDAVQGDGLHGTVDNIEWYQ